MNNYVVKPGDTIQSISDMFGINPNSLIKENNLNNVYFLVPGLQLVIPNYSNGNSNTNSDNSKFDKYIVVNGDSLYKIASRYNISVSLLTILNNIDSNSYIYPGQVLLVPKKDTIIYVTKGEDTLETVSNDMGVSINNLLMNNKNIYLLPGQIIISSIR